MRLALPLFGAVFELRHLRRTALHLLDTYVGHLTGEKILEGAITRGEGEILHAVFVDLRSARLYRPFRGNASGPGHSGPRRILRGRRPPGRGACGEILKFIGDGLLAGLPSYRPARTARPVCRQALAAATEAVDRLAALNDAPTGACQAPLVCGIALHLGDVMFGNIGTADRLDFTVIGPAVNLVSRIEALTKDLAPPIVCSADFAQALGDPLTALGSFELKGIKGLQDVFHAAPGNSYPDSADFGMVGHRQDKAT